MTKPVLRKIAIGLWIATGIVGLILFALMAKQAHAHDWYTDTGCCGGNDCNAVPLDAEWVQPTKDGYRVTLTPAQARQINPQASFAVDEVVPWHSNKIKTLPANVRSPALYHICIPASYSGIYCLFTVPGT